GAGARSVRAATREKMLAGAPQLRGAGLDPLGRGRGDRDDGPEAGKQPGRREADSFVAAAARDEGGPGGEVERVVCHLGDDRDRVDDHRDVQWGGPLARRGACVTSRFAPQVDDEVAEAVRYGRVLSEAGLAV